MIGQTDIKKAIGVNLSISVPMADALLLWSQMYMNQASWLVGNMKSLNLPAAISGEIARSVTIEMEVKLTGSARADYLKTQIDKLVPKLREQVEYGCAKGGLMMKPYAANGALAVDFVQADQFYPVSFDANGHITACVFSDQRTVGDKWYTRLEYHSFDGTSCTIINKAFVSDNPNVLGRECPLTDLEDWAELEEEATIENIEKPLFAYFRFPAANSIDPTSPLGVSCYARAADLIQQADQQWTDFLWEFESGRRAIYVDPLAFGKDKDGKPILPDQRLYRTLEPMNDAPGTTKLFEEWTPSLREQNLIAGLESIKRQIEFECGLAYGTLSNPQTVDKTATEIKISNQRSYATITDTQKALQEALDQLLYAMDIWATLASLAPAGTFESSYDFDDSVVVDKDAQFQQDLRVLDRVMSKVEFRMRNFGEDEATAQEALAKLKQEQPEPTDMFGNPVDRFNNRPE